MIKLLSNLLFLSIIFLTCYEEPEIGYTASKGKAHISETDSYLIVGEKSFLDGYEPIDN